jgi:2-polyprenyl-6-methoxyphenol hydroxylase-like FAD-dependent oxidoreductase
MDQPTSRHDVIVVGARAAGAATARLLARSGLDVVVLDRSRYGADTLSTHALMRAGVVQLHRWGLLDEVVAAGTPAVRRTTFHYADQQVTVTIKPSHGVDALYAPRRTVLDPILVDAAVAAGAQFRYGTTVSGVTRDRHGRVDGVFGHQTGSGAPVHLAADVVVGADGPFSSIARAVEAPVERSGTGATAVVYGYWPDLGVDGYQWVFRRDASAGVIPTNDGQWCVFAAATPEHMGAGGLEGLRRVVRRASADVADRLAAAPPPSAVRGFNGLPGHLRVPWGPGWALVGDAGYWKDPIGAHGLTDAFRDAELLARAISASASGADEADAFGEYHQTRNQVSVPLFDVVDTIAGMRWTDAEIPELLLRLSSAMTDEVELVARLDDEPALAGHR